MNVNQILGKLGGRKFLAALFTVLAIALHSWLGIDPNTVLTIGAVAATYIFGQSIADGMSGGATSTVAAVNDAEAAKKE